MAVIDIDGPLQLRSTGNGYIVVCRDCKTRKRFSHRLDAEDYYDSHNHDEEVPDEG
jgi:hypothetical protein